MQLLTNAGSWQSQGSRILRLKLTKQLFLSFSNRLNHGFDRKFTKFEIILHEKRASSIRERISMPQEIVLTTSSAADSTVLLYDLHTSKHIRSFRQSTTAANGITIAPSKCQFLAAQVDRGLVHVYSWGKDTITTKMILPDKIRSLEISPSGTWCVGGSESGKLFLWEVGLSEIA